MQRSKYTHDKTGLSENTDAMTTDAGQYQILEIPKDARFRKHMLGCIVPTDRHTAPFDKYAPYFDAKRWETPEGKKEKEELESTLEYFWRAPDGGDQGGLNLHDLISSQGAAKSSDVKGKITEALKAYFNKKAEKNFSLDAGTVEQYTIDNPGMALGDRLTSCGPWMNEVQRLYEMEKKEDKRKKLTYFIVTGVFTCSKVQVSWDEKASSKKGAEAKVPAKPIASAATGGASDAIPKHAIESLDSEVAVDRDREQSHRASAKIDDQLIFALRYHHLEYALESSLDGKQSSKPSGFFSRFRNKRTNSGLTQPVMTKLSMGQPYRGGANMISSYGNGPEGLFYWEEPEFMSSEDLERVESPGSPGPVQNGIAH